MSRPPETLICPACHYRKKRSEVLATFPGSTSAIMTTTPSEEYLYDSYGVRHSHKRYDLMGVYKCSRDHTFKLVRNEKCESSECDWPDGVRARITSDGHTSGELAGFEFMLPTKRAKKR